jgi:hypothetical protein
MAWRRASLASRADLRSSASILRLVAGSVEAGVVDSSLLHWGQRFAKPGLSGFSSNSSLQMAQTLMGKGISTPGIMHSSLALTPVPTWVLAAFEAEVHSEFYRSRSLE